MASCAASTAAVVAGVVPSASGLKSRKFFGGSTASFGLVSNGSRVRMSSEWMPGQPRPSYLDGSVPGFVLSLGISLGLEFWSGLSANVGAVLISEDVAFFMFRTM